MTANAVPGNDNPAPVPLLVVRRGGVSPRSLKALATDRRLAVFEADDLSPNRMGFAERVAAVVMATTEDPMSALVYALTAGVSVPIVLATSRRHAHRWEDARAAGAAACTPIPISAESMCDIVELLRPPAFMVGVGAPIPLALDAVGRVVQYRDRKARLTQREFALLHCLCSAQGRPVSVDAIYRYVWGEIAAPGRSQQVVAVYVYQLRHKLERLGLAAALQTVRGYGYALVGSHRMDGEGHGN